MKYRVRSDESGLMILTYGWRYSTLVKESVEVYLSESDLERAYSVFQSTLENNLTGVASSWGNPMTVHSGTVTPSRTVFLKDQSPCRDFGIVVNVGGNEARGYGRYFKEIGTACRGDVGVWQVLQD
jgi:surface antigen